MMKRTHRRSSPWKLLTVIVLVGGILLYVDRFIIPTTPAFAVPTATPTPNPESFANEAQESFNAGKLLPAIEAYKKAIRSDPTNQTYHIEMAKVQVWAGQYEDALETAERALVANEGYSMAHAVRGWALNFLKEYTEAEASLRTALEIDPNNALAHAYLAEVYINGDALGKYEKASQSSLTALDLAPNQLETLRARGYVLFSTGNYAEAMEFYQRTIAINRWIPDLHLNLAYCYQAQMYENPEYVDLAIDSFLQANSLNPANSIPDVELSRLFLQLGEYQKAIQQAENAVKDEPENPLRYGNLGIMHYENDEFNAAVKYLGYAVRGGTTDDNITIQGAPLTSDTGKYYWYYGFALAKVVPDRCSEAVQVFQDLITTLPDNEIAVANGTVGLEMCSALPEESETVEQDTGD